MPLSDFQSKKLIQVYKNLYDSNHDGVIDQEDFKDAMKKISTLHHWGKNDKAYTDAETTLGNIWDGLRTDADKNLDGKVTQEEWISMWTKTLDDIQAGKDFPEWQQKYTEFMFYANDTSGDGFIDKGEYVTIQKLFGTSDEDSKQAFDKLAEGTSDQMISKEDFTSLWKEYFLSSDAGKRGNYLFGMPPK